MKRLGCSDVFILDLAAARLAPVPLEGLRSGAAAGVQARAARQELLSRLETLEPPLDREAISALLGRASLGTAAIEGKLLDPGQVRSSIARRLRLPLAEGQPAASAQVEGLLDVLLVSSDIRFWSSDFCRPCAALGVDSQSLLAQSAADQGVDQFLREEAAARMALDGKSSFLAEQEFSRGVSRWNMGVNS